MIFFLIFVQATRFLWHENKEEEKNETHLIRFIIIFTILLKKTNKIFLIAMIFGRGR